MNKYLVERYKIAITKTPPWWIIAYLLIPDWDRFDQGLVEGFQKVALGQDKAFNSLVETHVSAYIEKGVMPPAAIHGAILNIAEDMIAGRTPTLRAGDYIALRTFSRAAK